MSWNTIKNFLTGKKVVDETAKPSTTDEVAAQSIFSSLAKTRENLAQRIKALFNNKDSDDTALREELEMILYGADLGTTVVEKLFANLDNLPRPWERQALLQNMHAELLTMVQQPRSFDTEQWQGLRIYFMIGVNGVGKTTTTAKLAAYYQQRQQKKVVLAAADTFRAAATEQLLTWAARLQLECIHQKEGADPAAVVFDAVQSALARQIDLLIIDTGGRLHNKQNLMESLQKMQRSVEKAHAKASPQSSISLHNLLVIDATTGQNALMQAKEFDKLVGISGIIVTKLDGSAKGGALVAVSHELKLPILFVGTGETVDALHAFQAEAFCAGLIAAE